MVSRVKNTTSTMALHCSQAKLWVKTHYERHEDGVVAKSVMYKHYEDYCREQGRNIMETSIFGRVVKSVFPDVTIRRLGGRDNLKYYYCGIQAKETSPHAIDNATTTRPKRRLRKRELITDRSDVHRCLLWLHKNYCASSDSSVVKSEVYDRYVVDCMAGAGEPLSMQYFGMVMTHAFPHIIKRKLGPRANQQKFYFGIQERPAPLPLDTVPPELLNAVERMFNNGKLCYREELEGGDEEDDDDDDLGCRSPVSDTSDGSFRDSLTPISGSDNPVSSSMAINTSYVPQQYQQVHHLDYPPEVLQTSHHHHHHYHIKDEPVDYSLQALQLKDEPLEPIEALDGVIKEEEPLDLHMSREMQNHMESNFVDSPERSPSITNSLRDSPSPSVKESKTRKIYKPRFHIISDYNDDQSWNSESDPNTDKYGVQYCNNLVESQWETRLREWLCQTFEECDGVCVNRDQVYSFYESFCDVTDTTVLPLTYFDETILKVFSGVGTMIHPTEKTYYEGIRVQLHSELYGRIEELIDGEPCKWKDMLSQHSMELSPPRGAAPRVSPHALEEEEGVEERYADNYLEGGDDDDLHSTPDVLKDGKYYLRMWLTDNFESVPDACVLKADAYRHYELYAKSIKQTPFEMNVFGKIVRQVFPKVSIRRLGGRVKPQYHYCGIAVKNVSPLFQYMSGKDPAQRSRKKEISTDNKSAEIVIEWLRRSYEPGTDKIIMKSAVFGNYCNYCKAVNEHPVTLNYFGKLVKHCFPNVEVRKCGGRTEPTWYYFGLIPRGSEGAAGAYLAHPPTHDDLSLHRVNDPSTTYSTLHMSSGIVTTTTSMPGGHLNVYPPMEEHSDSISHHQHNQIANSLSTSPIPISLTKVIRSGGGEGGGSIQQHQPQNFNNSNTPNGSYSSSSTMLQSVLLNQRGGSLAQSPLLSKQDLHHHQSSPFLHSPRDSLSEASPLHHSHHTVHPHIRHHPSEMPHIAAPVDVRSGLYRETLNSYSPAADSSSLREIRSPYETEDVPSDNMFSRSPGDSSAQYCRSPHEVMESICRSPCDASSSPLVAHSPGDTLLFSQSPLEASYQNSSVKHPRVSVIGGAQVVPGLVSSSSHPNHDYHSIRRLEGASGHQHHYNLHHKRHSIHLPQGMEDYEMISDMPIE